ncbi:MAG: Na/Pi cotransporter family protein [Clostridia bacterium]|nr:Na/Pi cotransporter family protein [Clostridia bacterium]
MSIFNILSMLCGLALFLFGMNFMGDTLKKSAGNKMKTFLSNMTSNRFKGFLLGMLVTAIIQSSSATTVMTVGFVNSGAMTLSQSIYVIMGANVGTTVTSWITGLSGLEGAGGLELLEFFKPSAFVPVLALVGILCYMVGKSSKRKNIGLILLGFSVLMVGMDMMSDAVKPLSESESFKNILLLFENPFFGVLAGMLMTAILQSSSASVGILQSLTVTGAVTFGNAVPILLGQNIGTCITAILSSVGTSRNAKRTAFVHFYFNVIGVVIFLSGFYLLDAVVGLPFMSSGIDMWGIAIVHTVFNIVAVAAIAPFSKLLEKLVCLTVKDKRGTDDIEVLDDRFLHTPFVAIDRSRAAAVKMSEVARESVTVAMSLIHNFDTKGAERVSELEGKADKYEDMIGTYLLKLSPESTLESENMQISEVLHVIGDLERISDHAMNLAESAEELKDKGVSFSAEALGELAVMESAVKEILELSIGAFSDADISRAMLVEPLEERIDDLRDEIKMRHIQRLQKNECTLEVGFVLSDILTNYERIADHCSNIASCMIELDRYGALKMHTYSKHIKEIDTSFDVHYESFTKKYSLPQ